MAIFLFYFWSSQTLASDWSLTLPPYSLFCVSLGVVFLFCLFLLIYWYIYVAPNLVYQSGAMSRKCHLFILNFTYFYSLLFLLFQILFLYITDLLLLILKLFFFLLLETVPVFLFLLLFLGVGLIMEGELHNR